jgi:1,4-dihydroxy-2-naphthoate octaprenyltransferase
MQSAEPTLASLSNPVQRYFLATRPLFLSMTLFACLIGLGTAQADGVAIVWSTAFATIVFALLAHAGVNVLNDYYDALNGTDAINTGRVFPYTGGSRFIQNGVLTLEQTARFGVTLFAVVMIAGVWLTTVSGAGLLAIGLTGLAIGWAYSAPPLKLNARGLGELCVMAGFALIVIGTDYVQRHAFAQAPFISSVSYALLVTNILYMNQFPDRAADAAAGIRHWVVRLAPEQARWGYVAMGTNRPTGPTGDRPRLPIRSCLSRRSTTPSRCRASVEGTFNLSFEAVITQGVITIGRITDFLGSFRVYVCFE